MDKNDFFEKYKVEKEFCNSDLSWDILEAIYDDYCEREQEMLECEKELEKCLRQDMSTPIHSLRCRRKDPKHLIEKIIRKRGKEQSAKYIGINVSNYREVVRDLIGARILVLVKEEWENVFEDMVRIFPESGQVEKVMAEPPVAYTRYGDRDIFKEKIRTEHTNKGYRSQHYVVKFNGYYCEIQVRTLSEEVYGEVDHKVKYPYRDDNRFLIRYTNTLSQLLDSVDELISTCLQMSEEGWERCHSYYVDDEYIDWKKISKETRVKGQREKAQNCDCVPERIEIKSYAQNIMLRKD